jgi:hypothetical protein
MMADPLVWYALVILRRIRPPEYGVLALGQSGWADGQSLRPQRHPQRATPGEWSALDNRLDIAKDRHLELQELSLTPGHASLP